MWIFSVVAVHCFMALLCSAQPVQQYSLVNTTGLWEGTVVPVSTQPNTTSILAEDVGRIGVLSAAHDSKLPGAYELSSGTEKAPVQVITDHLIKNISQIKSTLDQQFIPINGVTRALSSQYASLQESTLPASVFEPSTYLHLPVQNKFLTNLSSNSQFMIPSSKSFEVVQQALFPTLFHEDLTSSSNNSLPFHLPLRVQSFPPSTVEHMPTLVMPALQPLPQHTFPQPLDYSASNYDGAHNSSCVQVSACEELQERWCLGAQLPYTHTSLAMTRLHSQRQARAELSTWERSLRQLPRCWGVVQPYLCSVFLPPCHAQTHTLHLPPQDLCEAVRGPCELVIEGRGWPSYMQCEGLHTHPSAPAPTLSPLNNSMMLRWQSCSTLVPSVRELKFNSSSGVCVPPLVPTPRHEAWYPGVRGCGMPCQDPRFSRQETAGFRSFLAIMAGLSVASCGFTVLTYLLEWRRGGASRRRPSALLLPACGCCLVAGVALLVQYHDHVRETITCHADGTPRRHEPSTESNMSCVVVFACLYYFGAAATLWLLILAYSWHCFFRTLVSGDSSGGGGSGGGAGGVAGAGGDRGAAYYHLLAWSLPLVLTITTLALGQVSADNLLGVCFLSPELSVRLPLLLLPLTLCLAATTVFLGRGILCLARLRLECGTLLSPIDNSKIVESIVRLSLLLLTLLVCGAATLFCHVHHYTYESTWLAALRQNILCQAGLSPAPAALPCTLSSRPQLWVSRVQLLACTAAPLVLASFCWTGSTAHVWRTCMRRVIGVPVEDEHKVRALDPAPLDACSRLSGSLRSLQRRHPAGIKAIAAPGVARSEWGEVQRSAGGQPAVIPPPPLNTDSEHSISTRYSVESGLHYYASSRQQLKGRARRQSLDSQLSFHVSDVEREAARHTMVRYAGHSYTSRTSRVSRGKWPAWGPRGSDSRRGSYTSEDSTYSVSSVMVTGVGVGPEDTLFSNMMRRLNLSSSAASSPPHPASPALHTKAKQDGCSFSPCVATVGVQTSLDSAVWPARVDKAVQVSASEAPLPDVSLTLEGSGHRHRSPRATDKDPHKTKTRSRNNHKSERSNKVAGSGKPPHRRRRRKTSGSVGVVETSFLSDARSGSAAWLLDAGEARIPTSYSGGDGNGVELQEHCGHYLSNASHGRPSLGGRTSSAALTASKGTCLDAETISTILDMENITDSHSDC